MVCSLRVSLLLLSLIQCAIINPISATRQKNSLQSLRRQQQQQKLKSSTKNETSSEEGPYYVVKARETMALFAEVYPTLQDYQSSKSTVTINCVLHHALESSIIACHNRNIQLNITASIHKDTGILSYTDADGKIVDVMIADNDDDNKSTFQMNDNGGRTNARDGQVDTIVDQQTEKKAASTSSQWVYVKNQSMWLIPTVTIILVGTILFMIYCTCCCCQEHDDDDDNENDLNKKLHDDTNNTHHIDGQDHSGSAVFQDIDLTNIDILDEYSNRYEFDDPEVNIKEVPKVTPETTKL